MKLKTLILAALPLYMLGFGVITMSNSSGPSQPVAGSPLENGQTCAKCHGGTVNSGPGMIELTGVDNYVPGQVYQLRVSVNGTSSSKFGFQAVVLDGNDQNAGVFNVGVGTKKFAANAASYIEQSFASNNGVFEFEWVAPTAGTGDVTMYVAANAANGNNTTAGDDIYKAQFTIAEDLSSNLANIEKQSKVSVYPIPASSVLQVQWSETEDYKNLIMFDLSGKRVYSSRLNGQRASVQVSDFPAGQYLLQLDGDGHRLLRKVTIQ